MLVCCHWCMSNFTGRMALDILPDKTTLRVASKTRPWKAGTLELAVTLRCTALWYSWYMSLFPDALRVRIPAASAWSWELNALDCHSWAVHLPWIPVAIPLQHLCGYRPVGITISQDGTVLGKLEVQRRAHCVRLVHGHIKGWPEV